MQYGRSWTDSERIVIRNHHNPIQVKTQQLQKLNERTKRLNVTYQNAFEASAMLSTVAQTEAAKTLGEFLL